jgi:hypothetical protein
MKSRLKAKDGTPQSEGQILIKRQEKFSRPSLGRRLDFFILFLTGSSLRLYTQEGGGGRRRRRMKTVCLFFFSPSSKSALKRQPLAVTHIVDYSCLVRLTLSWRTVRYNKYRTLETEGPVGSGEEQTPSIPEDIPVPT